MPRTPDESVHNKRFGTVYDQHERPWAGYIDNKSGFPVGVLQPKGWRAPWYPPQGTNTFKFNADNPQRFTINYEVLLQERMEAIAQVDKDRAKAAHARGWDPTDPEKQEALDQIADARSNYQAPEVIVACMQGDEWILGFTDKVNEKVAKYLPKKVDRKTALLSKFPDFTAQDEESLERNLDLEEQFDQHATGGKMEKLPRKKKGVAA